CPIVNEVIRVSGIYNEDSSTLQAANVDDGIALTLDTSWIPNWSVANGEMCTFNGVVQIKEPWPVRETMLNSFEYPYQNFTIFPVENLAAVPGDVDGDGVVTSADVTALYNWLLNGDSGTIVNGDQDGDGTITSADVTFIYNILLGE
ncbi:MAG: dockerin type I repeat-containing protein, partial [Muribaculaceae bacterium]|nr:dockerin type I repeat-containing protein [Muribaculaceae bacterium]